ncbi:MAG: SDR family NAD(P)-dependent oxidoreductase [Alphaproteobacteria bacterium]|nr:SDR family NAD(P)-dependent oxidoreductase [Alphaproteobacteria bacterium]
MEIKGHSAIITGGGSGLGAATARELAKAGAKVGIIDVKREAAEAVAKEIGGAAAAADVTDAASLEAAYESLRKAIGPARILVACAGVATGAKLIGKDGKATPLDAFKRTIDINLMGTINCMRLTAADAAALPALEDGERGVMIGTASVAAFEGQVGQGAYSASKGAIVSITLTFARELAREGIRVNAISPGLMDTPMLAGLPDNVREALVATTLYPKRLGKPEEYAALARHIVENRFLNGSVIRFDGALRMAPR